ncbi:hypothetical protein T02_557 [Trichinella nativa]|uniref:Uncharacterized protein n=1 Tax=Trichinella nativa TaxID=6335 RepID=A0A0V1KKP4_9BILA|nr:hypothetical protein T02_557 [Trichinella nativa]
MTLLISSTFSEKFVGIGVIVSGVSVMGVSGAFITNSRTPFLPNAVLSIAHVTAFEKKLVKSFDAKISLETYYLITYGSCYEENYKIMREPEIFNLYETLISLLGRVNLSINSVLFDVIEKEYIRCIQFVIGRGLAESCQNEDLDDCDNKASFIAVEAAIILFENALQLDLDNNQIWKCIAHSGDILKKVGSLPVFRQTMYQI